MFVKCSLIIFIFCSIFYSIDAATAETQSVADLEKTLSAVTEQDAPMVEKNQLLIEKYRNACERIDIEQFLRNERLVSIYIKCILGRGPCNKDGEKLKKAITEIIETTCECCSPKQKAIVKRVMNYMYTNRRKDFDDIFSMYDPKNIHRTKMMRYFLN